MAGKKLIGPCLFCKYPRSFGSWGQYGFHLATKHYQELLKVGMGISELSQDRTGVKCFCTKFLWMTTTEFGDHLRVMGGLEAHLLERILRQ